MLLKLLAAGFLAILGTVVAQQHIPVQNHTAEQSTQQIVSNPEPGLLTPADGPVKSSQMTAYEFNISISLLIFGFAVIVIQFILMRRQQCSTEDMLRIFGVTLILIGTLFMMTAGFIYSQMAPVMGLFGTVAGYLLGKRPRMGSSGDSQEKRQIGK